MKRASLVLKKRDGVPGVDKADSLKGELGESALLPPPPNPTPSHTQQKSNVGFWGICRLLMIFGVRLKNFCRGAGGVVVGGGREGGDEYEKLSERHIY